jgi:uncharacterized protein YceH (UPF0502 family)
MNVSIHARAQLLGRMPAPEAVTIIAELEAAKIGDKSEARIIRRYGEQRSDGQSNGEVLVAIIEKGTVVTCYWRRGTQTFTAEGFRVSRLRDFTRTDEEQAQFDAIASANDLNRLAKAWGARRS